MSTRSVAELFDRYHLPLYRFVLRCSGERQTAEDLTQEVFLRALRARPETGSEAGIRAWLFTVARNLLVDRARRGERRPRPVALEEAAGERPPAQGLRLGLERALAELPAEDREVFLLSQVGGLSYQEVAESVGLSKAAVRSRIFRARCRLRELLEVDHDPG